jgi:hypothetical protein
MAAKPTIATLNLALVAWRNRAARLYPAVANYWALTKPEVNFLILLTTFAGFYLASKPGPGRTAYDSYQIEFARTVTYKYSSGYRFLAGDEKRLCLDGILLPAVAL